VAGAAIAVAGVALLAAHKLGAGESATFAGFLLVIAAGLSWAVGNIVAKRGAGAHAPDMFALARQVQITSDTAKGAVARLAGVEAPAMPDTETTFAELKARCDTTIAYVQSIDAAALETGASREIVMNFPNGGGMKFDGLTYLTGFVLPNFYFHATTAYDILRHNGVEIGKRHFMGNP